MNIVVIGSGMYVSGRGTDEYGIVMPAICEWKKAYPEGCVDIIGTHGQRMDQTKIRIQQLQMAMGLKFPIRFHPSSHVTDPYYYKKIMTRISVPKAAIIAVPDHLHFTVAYDAISNGFHTLVAKPLTPTIKEAISLCQLQKKKKVYCAVEFHKRYDEANIKLKDILRSGKLGVPLYFVVEYSQRKHIPYEAFSSWVSKTNVFQYLGVHYVDIIYYLTGSLPVRAMAIGQKKWLKGKGINNYDAIQGVLEWKGFQGLHFFSYILTHWVDPNLSSALSDQRIQVIGTSGKFSSDQKYRGVHVISDEKGVEDPNPYFTLGYGVDGFRRYSGYGIRSIHSFLTDAYLISKKRLNLEDVSKDAPTFQEALVSTAAIDAINRSLKSNGKWVTIKHEKKRFIHDVSFFNQRRGCELPS
ncbi:MAG: Gfo/Idh/MocA family oxidoreductase [Deltaproteobacteria bacterium]|nr:Gfo/Idh/MocA family oxidoreductase [Deltaproteobacteria bacterium]